MKNDFLKNNVIMLLVIMPLLPITSSFKLTIFSSLVLFLVLLLTLFNLKYVSKIFDNNYYEGYVILISLFYLSMIRLILTSIGFNIIYQLDVYFSLIGVNSIILYLYESRIKKRLYIKKEIISVIFALLFIIIFSLFRELIGSGSIDFSIRVGEDYTHFIVNIRHLFKIFSYKTHDFGLSFFILPSGGLILLGFFIALYRFIKSKINR